MKKDNVKYGIYFLLGWNVFVLICIGVKYLFFNPHVFENLFGNSTVLWCSVAIVFLWSLTWFVIGYFVRKGYVVNRASFRKSYPHLEATVVDKYYRYSYLAKYAGFLYKVVWISIPVYILWRREFFDGDFVVMILLALLGAALFYTHRFSLKKSRL